MKRPNIMSYGMPLPKNVAPWEKATLAKLEQAMKEQGLLGD